MQLNKQTVFRVAKKFYIIHTDDQHNDGDPEAVGSDMDVYPEGESDRWQETPNRRTVLKGGSVRSNNEGANEEATTKDPQRWLSKSVQ